MSTSKIYCGIDPGKKGAVCFLDESVNFPIFIDWPKDDSISSIASTFNGNKNRLYVVIEKVGAMPKQGVVSMFNFGRNFGQWLGLLQTLGIPYHLLTPQQWRKGIVFPSDGDPKQAAQKAYNRLFPNHSKQICGPKGGIKDGRIDACLMACRARFMYK